ncbi:MULTISPECIES: hypothetical protein [unclassified Kitasatospora]|uniref:hypothetical protein n=1 Tax=unclassified Kitasatospora TaxID=2633591 RepID=UPI00070A4298|nr:MULTISPECIES: hypothetical protein [unclassified Kitasatospora]KQV17102.1 hypothetical protein ASC99_26135 [Kitasatospora sp. Root107]KRB72645.1 hypothetical protein ASE03_22735 [Kitasatospora sp. Root187]
MESRQRVVRRNTLLSRLLNAAAAVALALLVYSVIRDNLPDQLRGSWPWKLKFLDIQSATTAALAALGASLARAQYARTVRPALGHSGRAVDGMAPFGQRAWACSLTNAGQDVAVVSEISYLVTLLPAVPGEPSRVPGTWGTALQAIEGIAAEGLEVRKDFMLTVITAGTPLPGQGMRFLGWFTEKAMRVVDEVYIRVQVVDRVGDTHERIIACLKAADRSPAHIDPELS